MSKEYSFKNSNFFKKRGILYRDLDYDNNNIIYDKDN
jgi:hypothetical protein